MSPDLRGAILTVSLFLLGPALAVGPAVVAREGDPERDAWLERALREGRIVEVEALGSGITRPSRITIEYEGEQVRAAFKTVDINRRGVYKLADGTPRFNFVDSYRFEVAAYLLDRRLRIHMVPVAVLRSISGDKGALVEWVEDGLSEKERHEQGIEPPNPFVLDSQQKVMGLFDALILNEDRNQQNQLITRPGWELHLIDHSRAFRRDKRLPDSFLRRPVALTRDLHEALRSLEMGELKKLMGKVLTGPEIKSLLQRRDAILEKIEQDRKSYGDRMVFIE